jgi:hypothetical protein
MVPSSARSYFGPQSWQHRTGLGEQQPGMKVRHDHKVSDTALGGHDLNDQRLFPRGRADGCQPTADLLVCQFAGQLQTIGH